MDGGGGQIAVSVWGAAHHALVAVPKNSGVAIVGCNATLDSSGQVKLNIWPSAHVCATGVQVQSLTDLDPDSVAVETLTPTFTPGQDLLTLVLEEAHPTCAAALADANGHVGPITFQINRCMLGVPMQEELIFAQSGRPFIKNCRLRDPTGGVDVDVVSSAVVVLFGCADEEALKAQASAQSLTSVKARVNARGVLRDESGVTRRHVVQVELTSSMTSCWPRQYIGCTTRL